MPAPIRLARWLVVAALACSWSAHAQAARPLPPQLTFVNQLITLYDEGYGYPGYVHLDWSELEFGPAGLKQGGYWKLAGKMAGGQSVEQRFAAVKAAFLKEGWTVVDEKPNSGRFRLPSPECWAAVDTREDVSLQIIAVGPNPTRLTLKPPAPKPETIDVEKGDLPYLAPIPGAAFQSGLLDKRPFWVQPKDAPQPELIAEQSLVRNYTRPETFSNLQFVTTYREALLQAGWEIVSQSLGSDAQLIAHYSKSGRNLWANLHQNYGSISFAVAERGTDLKSELARDCHIALYGLFFDFNKSTLQPVSDPVLQQVLALLKASPALTLEVQGHTDNIGDAAYNQTLSEARAAAVVAWLEAHGINKKRLSSRGFGKTQPVADNATDEGRAKNRRVELRDPRCKAKGP